MNSKDIKSIRGSIRQIVKEFLPEILVETLYQQIEAQVKEGLKVIETRHKESLDKMAQHQKDTLSYLVRQTTSPRTSDEQK